MFETGSPTKDTISVQAQSSSQKIEITQDDNMGLKIEFYPEETGEHQVLITLTDNGSDNALGINSNEVKIT